MYLEYAKEFNVREEIPVDVKFKDCTCLKFYDNINFYNPLSLILVHLVNISFL